MTSDQATAEAGTVIPINGWFAAALILASLLCWVLTAWRNRIEARRARWADIDQLLAAERRANRKANR